MVNKKYFVIAVAFAALVFLFVDIADAQSTPTSFEGMVFDADTGLQISERVHISILNENTGYYVEGMTGTYYNPGRYAVVIDGNSTDSILVTVWNDYHNSSQPFNLGQIGNIDLNMTSEVEENNPPEVISEPVLSAVVGKLYRYDVDAEDVDGDALEYHLVESPGGMGIDSSTGVIEWIPKLWQVGSKEVVVEVNDGRNGTDRQEFEIDVRWRNGANITLMNVTKMPDDVIHFVLRNGSGSLRGEAVLREIGVEEVESEVVFEYSDDIKKPKGTKTAARKVYSYFEVFPLNVGSEEIGNIDLVFSVSKEWLDKKHVDKGRIELVHFRDRQWYPLETEMLYEDDEFVYYFVETEVLGYFAIVQSSVERKTQEKAEMPFFIVGGVYESDGKTYVESGTSVKIENLNSREVVELETGIGPMGGAYAVIFSGKKGDDVTITVDEVNRYSFKLTNGENNVDFVRKRFTSGFNGKVVRGGEGIPAAVWDFLKGLFG